MVKIRLARMGAKKKPFYRIVVADSRVQRDGRWVEHIGYYDPMKNPFDLKVDLERADYWLSVGAQPTETVGRLLTRARTQGEGEAAAPAEA